MKMWTRFIASFSLVLLATACSTPQMYHASEKNIADVKNAIQVKTDISNKKSRQRGIVEVKNDLYVDTTPISLEKHPAWMSQHIILRGDSLPFSYYARTAVSGAHVLVRYQTGLNRETPLSMNFTGTVKQALDQISAKTGFAYYVDGNCVKWKSLITKTYEIAFMPGESDYMLGRKSGGTPSTSAPAGQGGSKVIISSGAEASSEAQFSNLSAKLSIWKDITKALNEMKSKDGKIFVSEATSSVTVSDHPVNIETVSRYIKNLNQSLAKQVLIKVEVLEVSLDHDFNYGVNWDIVQKAFHNTNFILNSNAGVPTSISSLTGAAIPSGGLSHPTGTTGIGILINALKQQGSVSTVTKPRVVSLNNQVAEIRIVTQEGYLASIENTSRGSGDQDQITSQVTPGKVVTGLTLYMLPKVMGNKVFLQISADLSSNLGIRNIFTSGSDTIDNTGTKIQVPEISQKQFNQRSMIESGATLILAGFKRVSNTANNMKVFDSSLLGGKGSLQHNEETIVLITPLILHGAA